MLKKLLLSALIALVKRELEKLFHIPQDDRNDEWRQKMKAERDRLAKLEELKYK